MSVRHIWDNLPVALYLQASLHVGALANGSIIHRTHHNHYPGALRCLGYIIVWSEAALESPDCCMAFACQAASWVQEHLCYPQGAAGRYLPVRFDNGGSGLDWIEYGISRLRGGSDTNHCEMTHPTSDAFACTLSVAGFG